MKIAVHIDDPQQLIVRLTPAYLVIVIFFGVLLCLMGPLIVYLLGWVISIDVHNGQLLHRQSLLRTFLLQETTLAIDDIQKIETSVRDSGVSARTAVVVVTSAGEYDIFVGDMSGDEKRKLAEQLNEAVGAREDFHFSTDASTAIYGSLIFGGILSVLGLFCLSFLQTTWIHGDRGKGQLRVAIGRWILPQRFQRVASMAIQDFSHVGDSAMTVASPGTPTASSNFVFLESVDGNRIPLAHGPMFTESGTREISELITNWVGQLSDSNAQRNQSLSNVHETESFQ